MLIMSQRSGAPKSEWRFVEVGCNCLSYAACDVHNAPAPAPLPIQEGSPDDLLRSAFAFNISISLTEVV